MKKTFDAVTVRESISFEAVKDYGIDSAILAHDPAFLLSAKNAPPKQNAIGINLSPLALGLGSNDMIMSNYVTLIRYLLDNTDMKVYLIPHVVWKDNDDRIPLTLLKKAFDSNRQNKPCFVRISVDSEENVLPFVPGGKANIDSIRD